MNTFALIFCFMAYGSIEPVFSLYLSSQFGLSDSAIAAIFCVPTLAYPIAAICVNLLSRKLQRKVLLMIAIMMVSIGMVLDAACSWIWPVCSRRSVLVESMIPAVVVLSAVI